MQFFLSAILFICISFCTFVASRVTTLKHNNEELRNTNGCYLVTQFSGNPTNQFIISKLSFLAKVTIKDFAKFPCCDVCSKGIFVYNFYMSIG